MMLSRLGAVQVEREMISLFANVRVILRLTEGALRLLGCWLNGHKAFDSRRVRR
ncbi:MAG: hypothetical protein AB8D78_06225 [Akkermansiaceae bacterium]